MDSIRFVSIFLLAQVACMCYFSFFLLHFAFASTVYLAVILMHQRVNQDCIFAFPGRSLHEEHPPKHTPKFFTTHDSGYPRARQ